MEKRGILLSHLYIYKFIKNILIKIFLYNIDLEKYIYSFYARGNNTFSEAFYYRLKRKGKKKGPFSYERYKPDLFFSLFLYYSFFSKKRKKKKLKKKYLDLIYNSNKNKKNKKGDSYKYFKEYLKIRKDYLSGNNLNNIKNNNLNYFIKLPEHLKKNEDNSFLKISYYEDKIKKINITKLNIGFLDFLTYLFFKINMLEKEKEEIIKRKERRKN
jgi:hypothetical protein